jgi:hypothetical protein
MKSVLTSSKYYTNLLQEIDSNAMVITIPTGLPKEVVEEIVLLEEVQEDVNSHLEKAFAGEEYQPDLEKIRSRLISNVEHYLAEKNIIPDQELNQSIEDYINLVTKEYLCRVKLPLLEHFIRMNTDYQSVYFVVLLILISVILICMIILYRLTPRLQYFLYYAYNSTLAASLMLAVFSIILLMDRIYTGLQITPNSFYQFMIDYITTNLHIILSISILFLALSLALLVAERVVRSKDIKMRILSNHERG